jgi:NADH:ubiquinone oxidoreductase subunit 6 (subunit J)
MMRQPRHRVAILITTVFDTAAMIGLLTSSILGVTSPAWLLIVIGLCAVASLVLCLILTVTSEEPSNRHTKEGN